MLESFFIFNKLMFTDFTVISLKALFLISCFTQKLIRIRNISGGAETRKEKMQLLVENYFRGSELGDVVMTRRQCLLLMKHGHNLSAFSILNTLFNIIRSVCLVDPLDINIRANVIGVM